MNFKELHNQEHPLLICNIWDVPSAKAAQKYHFQAIGTSSGAVAALLGYEDGENIPFGDLARIVERIAQSIEIPLSVDLEGGYSRDPQKVAEHISLLADFGVVGVNLEDSVVVQGKREFLEPAAFAQFLEKVRTHLSGKSVYINARTDAYILQRPNPLEETLERGKRYQDAGADGLFAPFIAKQEEIGAVTQALDVPLNVLAMPDLPSIPELHALGVKRISLGSALFQRTNRWLKKELEVIQENNSLSGLFA